MLVGVSDEYTYSHVIQNIQNIRKDGVRNKWHPVITGKRCNNADKLCVGIEGAIIIEPYWYHDVPSWFYMTLIQNVDKREDGTIVVRTRNSIYTFIPNVEEEDNDLSGQCSNDSN